MEAIFDNVILTDADGVFLLWEHGFHMWMLENGYPHVTAGSYNIEETYGIDKDLAEHLARSFNESAALKRLPPLKDAIKYIRKLHEEHGYVFHCFTAIPNTRDMFNARLENIENLFGKTPFERLVLTDNSAGKKKYLEQYRDSGCYWIEDLVKNAEVGHALGLNCILMDRHYNRGYENPEIKRVKNWKEIYQIITGEV